MDDLEFDSMQLQLHDALDDIFAAYLAAGRTPTDGTVAAFANLFDCSHNEFRKLFSRYVQSRSSL